MKEKCFLPNRYPAKVIITKTLLVMKLSAVLLIAACLQVSAKGNAQHISISQRNTTLEKVFREIHQKTGYQFFYQDELLKQAKKFDIVVKNAPLEKVLELCFKDQPLNFTIIEKTIIIKKREILSIPNAPPAPLIEKITGTVKDEKGNPLAGVSVTIIGETGGVNTDGDGNFSIEVPENGVLSFSYIGYKTVTATVKGKNSIDITLTVEVSSMNDVVVVGYGSVRKKDLTGSVSSVSSKKLMETATFSTAQALQGKASGVVVQVTDAKPGTDPRVMIRGNRSISATNDPLYVVDGIPLTGGLGEISQSNIESIDILKDASATAIYGSRGANGVIIITTKKGIAGKTVIEYNGYYGQQEPAKLVELFDGPEWVELMREAYRTAGLYPATPTFTKDMLMLPLIQENDPTGIAFKIKNAYNADGTWNPDLLKSTDWTDAVLRRGLITNHEVGVRGGTAKLKTYVSGNYYNQAGIIKGQDFSRYSFRVNFDWNLTDAITLGGYTSYSHVNRNDGTNLFSQTQSLSPLANIRNEAGGLIGYVGNDGQLWNPVLNLNETVLKYRKDRILGSYYLEAKLPWGFKFRSNVGLDVGPAYIQSFYGSMSSDRQGALPRASDSSANSTIFTWENLIFWNKRIDKHSFGVTMLQSIQQERAETNNISVKDLPYATQLWNNVGSAPSIEAVSSDFKKWQLASFMGRVNYSYKDRYLFTGSVRYDGSSRLADGHKWVLFPSAALAWRVSEEAFLENVAVLNNLKFRVGYGITGNTAIDPYKTSGNLAINRYNYGNTNVLGFVQNEMPNPGLSWERTKQWNAGIDFGLFKNRISGVIDVYLQNTSDLLMNRQLPNVSGFSRVVSNIGKTRNKGIEITINTANVRSPDFTWNTDFIFSHNKEEIVGLSGGKNDDVGNGWFIGQPLSVYYDYRFQGIWQLGEEAEAAKYGSSFVPGTIKILDKNGDYKITTDDRVIIGTPRPKFTISLSNYFTYKDFDLNFFFNSSFGNMLSYSRDLRFTGRYNSIKVNYWRVTEYDAAGKAIASNGSNEAPRPNKGVETIPYVSSMNYYDASFVRLSNAALGYTIPNKVMEKVGISKLRLYLSIQNAFVITKYPGTDPESGAAFGVPNPRTIMVGVNMGL